MEVYTPEEVAAILKISPFTVREWLKAGKLKGMKIGTRYWRVRKEDLEAYLNGQADQGK